MLNQKKKNRHKGEQSLWKDLLKISRNVTVLDVKYRSGGDGNKYEIIYKPHKNIYLLIGVDFYKVVYLLYAF